MTFLPAVPRALAVALVMLAVLVAGAAGAPPAAEAAELSGIAFKDANRDGAWQMGEDVLPDQQIYLFTGETYAGSAVTDAYGRYAFTNLADGDYRVQYASPSWWPLRADWVPTTTGGALRPQISLHLSGSARADFGWRPILRSADPAAPLSTYVAPNGLTVSSYDDVVSARELYDALALGLIGEEAPKVEVRFDLGSLSMTSTSVAESGGVYSSFRAIVAVSYLSWVESGDVTLAHEYGHAWSLYRAYILQQDPSLGSYLDARGLGGETRVNSSYAWSPREMIAEDYRQLFGSSAAQAGGQTNTEIPRAADVPGLAAFLSGPFSTAKSTTTPPPPPPPAAAELTISSLAVNPNPVSSSALVGFSLSDPATVTAQVLTSKGALVRTLLPGVSRPAGLNEVAWDRRDARGRSVKRGTYKLQVQASDPSGRSATASVSFTAA